jgi:type III secretory pathway lipoprotein EscJ
MRTDPAEPSPSISNRLRTRAAVSLNRFSGLTPLGRLVMLGSLAAASGLIGYGVLTLAPAGQATGREWLFDGNRFSQAEVAKITKILEASQLDPVADGGRIGVPRSRMDEARSLLGKAGLGPRRMDDLIDETSKTSIFEPPLSAEKKLDFQQARFLKAAIDRLDPELSASVQIHRKRPVGFGRASESVEAHVYLDIEGNQKINSQQVEAIKNLTVTLVPDLKPEGLYLIDGMGNVYLSPTNPSLGHRSRAKAREEELADKIATTLNWIPDLRVTVTVDPLPAPPLAAPEGLVVETPPEPIFANQPLEAEPEAQPAEPVAAVPAEPDADAGGTGKATVFLQVPVSYVVRKFNAVHGTSRRPAREDLEPLFRQERQNIIARVRNIVPETELARVEVDKFDTDAPPAADAPPASPGLTLRSWWIPAALSGTLAALALAALGGWRAARRPVSRPRPTASRNAARRLAPAPTSPSERVRELIRIDPAAAAGVLHRWIGQHAGGHDA